MTKNAERRWNRITSRSGEFFFLPESGVELLSLEFLALAGDFCARKQKGSYGSSDMT
jgi:hypothetical protein